MNLFRSVINDDPFDSSSYENTKKRYYDPDLQDAWEELDAFLNEGKSGGDEERRYERGRDNYRSREKPETDNLKKDYANLEVPFGSSFLEVKKSYKKLLRKYHPDKFANNPNKLKIATEITKKINESFARIREYERKRTGNI